MSTAAVIGILKDERDWAGVYVHSDGHLEGVGARLIDELNRAAGSIDKVANRAVAAQQGWFTLFDQAYGTDPVSPCPRGVAPQTVGRADPAYVYLFDRGGKLHVFATPLAGTPSQHGFAGLRRFERLCSVAITAHNDPQLLLKSVEPALLWRPPSPAPWANGAIERKTFAGLLAAEAARRGATPDAFRAECRTQLAALLKEKLSPEAGPIVVRFGDSICAETDVAGLAVRSMRPHGAAGALELLQQSGPSFRFDQLAILPELEGPRPALFAAAKVILTKHPGWLLECLAWFRQEQVPDAVQGKHLPLFTLTHPDGRRWGVEVMGGVVPEKARLTIVITDSDGDTVERTRELQTYDDAVAERERLLREMRGDGFKE